MTFCGYCNKDVEKRCYDSKDAMKCDEVFLPIDADDDEDDEIPPELVTCEFCHETVDSVCIDKNMVSGCALYAQYDPAYDVLSKSEGVKHDDDKTRMDLLPPEFIYAVAQVLTFGANKYDDRNWEKGMKWGRVFGAAMRHLWSWWGGSKRDPETGFSHLWHAGCCIAFLIAYEDRGTGEDDRPKHWNYDWNETEGTNE